MNGKKARKERAERKRWQAIADAEQAEREAREEAEEQLLEQCIEDGSVIEIRNWYLSEKTKERYRKRRREYWDYPERFGQDNNVLEFREP